MLTFEVIATFFVTAVFLALAPGPDNIFVLTQSALFGARAGLVTVLGLMTGIVGHTLAVALGVAVIFQTSSLAFWILKLCGAAYLLYLAYLSFQSGSSHAPLTEKSFVGYGALYKRGVIMNITNPKVSLFFLALLPQFVNAERGSVSMQMLLLGLLFMLATLLVFGLIALLGGQLALWFNRSPHYQKLLNRIAAAIFFLLACGLIFT